MPVAVPYWLSPSKDETVWASGGPWTSKSTNTQVSDCCKLLAVVPTLQKRNDAKQYFNGLAVLPKLLHKEASSEWMRHRRLAVSISSRVSLVSRVLLLICSKGESAAFLPKCNWLSVLNYCEKYVCSIKFCCFAAHNLIFKPRSNQVSFFFEFFLSVPRLFFACLVKIKVYSAR